MDKTGVAPETILIDFSGLSIHKLYQLDIYMAKQPAESSFILLRFSEKNPAELVRGLQIFEDAGFIIDHLIKFKGLLIERQDSIDITHTDDYAAHPSCIRLFAEPGIAPYDLKTVAIRIGCKCREIPIGSLFGLCYREFGNCGEMFPGFLHIFSFQLHCIDP